MSVAASEDDRQVRRRWPRVAGAAALLLGLALLGLWLARKPIARGEADRFLARAGVPARYTLTDLGLGRQRLTDVVVGDPAHPDLVADWLETRTDWGFGGPYLASVRGGHVRVRARWAEGRLSLGSIDWLLPKGEGGKPFSLPALALDVADLRARVETPWGVIGAKLAGSGRLDGGFSGRFAATGAALGADGCGAVRPSVAGTVRTAGPGLLGRAPSVTLTGSAEAQRPACAGAGAGYANANGTVRLSLGQTLGWETRADVAAQDLRAPQGRARSLAGRIALTGGARIAGRVALAAGDVVTPKVVAARVTADGAVTRDAAAGLAYDGRIGWTRARADVPVGELAAAGQGTPVQPLAARLAPAIAAAARAFDGSAAVSLTAEPNGLAVAIARAEAIARSGASLRIDGARWSSVGLVLDGIVEVAGGGLPEMRVTVRREPSGPYRGTLAMAPYAAGGASLALAPTRFAFDPGGGGWVDTVATLSGPLGDGRVEALRLPLRARWSPAAIAVNRGCTPVAAAGLLVSGLRLDRPRATLCATGAALVRVADGRVTGGARLPELRLRGALGSSPLAIDAEGASVDLAERGFSFEGLRTRIGAPERDTRINFAALAGRFERGALGGAFAGGVARIGAVPLAMSGAAGDWRFASGALAVDGALSVSDTADPARFQPMTARGVALRLADGRIAATGTLHEPTTGAAVAAVTLRHDLSAGTGAADLTVPGLAFAKGFQPDLLTRLTFGVIADVRGTVTGEGHIAWSPAGVTSTGVFRTGGTDLAAAFGPVTGLAGEIRFTDLLALQSAPGQRVTVKSINPGVPVTDGAVTFQTLPGTRVQVEDARWPFAGGALTLDPTLLDFSGAAQRRMTFHVAGAAADKFLQSFDFKNLDATGVFDGTLPMVFDASGGRIENGRLAVRPGGGTIAYVGAVGQKNLGFWANFAFDALKSLRYRSLAIVMNGPLAGEMVTEVRFAGISQGAGAKSNFLIRRLQRLPFVFNVRIQAPFRGLLDATASFYDPRRLIERNLPALIEQRKTTVQPPASETMP